MIPFDFFIVSDARESSHFIIKYDNYKYCKHLQKYFFIFFEYSFPISLFFFYKYNRFFTHTSSSSIRANTKQNEQPIRNFRASMPVMIRHD